MILEWGIPILGWALWTAYVGTFAYWVGQRNEARRTVAVLERITKRRTSST